MATDRKWPGVPVRVRARKLPFEPAGRPEKPPDRPAALSDQIAVCSEISSSSSTSIPRHHCTSEDCACCLDLAGDPLADQMLAAYLVVYPHQ